MLRIVRSELVRLRRRATVLGWLGLTAVATVIVNLFVFQSAGTGSGDGGPPGRSFPTAAELAGSGGLVAGVSTVVSILGVISLIYWALATTSDFSSGLVRLTVQAEPRRWRLVLGKALALTGWTAVAATIALVVNVAVAPLLAGAFDISTSAWGTDLVARLASTWLNLFLALAAWGLLGLVIGVLTRSAGAAIGIGIGYVLLFEPLLQQFASSIASALPGSVLTALASGGNSDLAYGNALAYGVAYGLVGLAAAITVFVRRDVSD